MRIRDRTIPHPRIGERAFVLAPLADIIPDFRHPQTGETIEEMLDRLGTVGVERLFEMQFPSQTDDYAVGQGQVAG